MAKNITTTERKPTAQQKAILRLTMRPQGATRAEILKGIGKADIAYNAPVQTMVKTVAERFGHTMITEYNDNPNGGPSIAVYGLRPKAAKRAAATSTRSPRKVAR